MVRRSLGSGRVSLAVAQNDLPSLGMSEKSISESRSARGEAMNRLRELSAKKYLQPKSTDRSGGCAGLAVHIPARNVLSSPPKNGPFHFLIQAHNPGP